MRVETFVSSTSGERSTATRMAACACALCTSSAGSGSGATAGLSAAGAVVGPRLCAQVSSSWDFGHLDLL